MLKIFKALADETRLRLLGILAHGDFNVNELIDILEMGQSRISRHLKILAESGLVTSRREGNWVYYHLLPANGNLEFNDAVALAIKAATRLSSYKADLQHIESVMQRRRALSQKYFNKVGSDWERLQREMLNSDAYRDRALALLPARRHAAADLGAGAGLLLPALLEKFDRIIAIDSSPNMLQIAADFLQQQKPARAGDCELRLGELEHLPIRDACVDAAIALMVLHHVPNPQDALAEAFRILRPGGILVVADLQQHDIVEMRDRYADLWLGFTAADLEKWLRAAGFAIQQHEVMQNGELLTVLLYQALKPA